MIIAYLIALVIVLSFLVVRLIQEVIVEAVMYLLTLFVDIVKTLS